MRKHCLALLALVVGVTLFAAPARVLAADPHDADVAADTHAAEAVEGHGDMHGAEGAHEGSPNLFSVDPGLLIWTIVTFVVVLIVLRMTAWGPLMSSLAERQRNIAGAIEEAQRAKSEAEALLARHRSMLDGAQDEVRAILEEARKDGQHVRDQIRAAADKEAEEFKDRARREIDAQKNQATAEIWDLAGHLSTELATRILGRSLNDGDQERLVRDLIQELKSEVGSAGRENA
ncbi:MAG: F0F1 ATP synthase subunit B [bacterium]